MQAFELKTYSVAIQSSYLKMLKISVKILKNKRPGIRYASAFTGGTLVDAQQAFYLNLLGPATIKPWQKDGPFD